MNIFPRTRKQRLAEQTTQAASKHRKRLTVTVLDRKKPIRSKARRELFSTDLTVTKTPPWLKRRRNRAANKVARAARRKNRIVRRGK